MTEVIGPNQIERNRGFAPWDDVVVDSEVPVGLSIVGQAQAGKSTARGWIEEAWVRLDTSPVLSFSASDGFRGLCAAVIERAGLDPTITPDRAAYEDALLGYLGAHEPDALAGQLDTFYLRPRDKTVIRSKAVDDIVSYTSGHPLVRPSVNAAASRHLSRIFQRPELAKLTRPPGLVVLDARNADECLQKFTRVGVRPLGTVVLTCNEMIAAGRKLDSDVPTAVLMSAADKLKQRNKEDRERPLAGGRMTLPEDLRTAYAAELPAKAGDEEILYEYGRRLPVELDSGLVVATDTLPPEQEAFALDISLRGMLSVAYVAAKR